jgi:hypothetical protein
MKKKTKQMIGVVLLIAAPFIVSCEPEPKIVEVEVEKDVYHDYFGAIYAFGGAREVKGVHGGNPQAMTVAQFKTALGKLQQVMSLIELDYSEGGVDWNSYVNMLSRPIIIGTGNVGPAADNNKSMTIGVGYLDEKSINVIFIAIDDKVIVENVFANANGKSNVQMAGVTPQLNKQVIAFNNIEYKCFKCNKMVIVSATVV